MDEDRQYVREHVAGPVRLSVTQVDIKRLYAGGEVLLDVEEPDTATVLTRATAWAEVRGFDRLASAIAALLSGDPPASGFAALINKPHSVLVYVTWPWCPPGGR